MLIMKRSVRNAFVSVAVVALLSAGCERGASTGAAPVAAPAAKVSQRDDDITPTEAKALLDANQGYVYLDVRTVAEFKAGHVPGSMNIPYLMLDESGGRVPNPDFLKVTEAALAKDAKIIVGCRSGSRSARAKNAMKESGYRHLTNVLGGFVGKGDQLGWSALQYPVETGDGGQNSYANLKAKQAP